MRTPAVQFIFILLAALSAFTLAPAKSGVRAAVQTLFVPVAVPVRAVGVWTTNRLSPPRESDILSPDKARNIEDVRRQNTALITRLGNLEAQLEDLRRLSAQYGQLGDLRNMVRPAMNLMGSPTNRQTITLSTTNLKNVHEKQPVVHPGGFVGQIYDVATAGSTARVLLVTDPESRLYARFVRYRSDENGVRLERVDTKPPLVEGNGRGLVVRMLPAREVMGVVNVGDVALLDDPDPAFPAVIKGLRLGTVRRILPTEAGHATIELDPTADFAKLAEVLVVDR
ncbi:MAG TPA: rod shape-determining protein MreC [Tepidisphaeraceae bacterium]|jgi:cell shape-determining protein MreC